MGIHIITDSASDLIYGTRSDLSFLPLTVMFGEEEYQDGVTLSHREFYEKLIEGDNFPTTSQVSPYAFSQAIAEQRAVGNEVIVITLSGKLSGTYESAEIAARDFAEGVYVVDSLNATIGEKILVELALRYKDEGMAAADIAAALERERHNICLVALLDTLEYLAKGGRIPKSVAAVGGALSVKPVVGVEDGEVVVLGKARGSKKGNNLLVEQIQKAGGVDFDKPYAVAYSGLSDALLRKYIEDSNALWAEHVDGLQGETVGATIGSHVGPGAVAVAFFRAR